MPKRANWELRLSEAEKKGIASSRLIIDYQDFSGCPKAIRILHPEIRPFGRLRLGTYLGESAHFDFCRVSRGHDAARVDGARSGEDVGLANWRAPAAPRISAAKALVAQQALAG